MGCDIHPVLEVHDVKTNQWVAYTRPDSNRNYAWFGIIAGVRDSQAPMIIAPKGLPPDASIVSQRVCDEENDDLHSHSWLSSKEISEAWRRYMDYVDQEKKDEVEILVGKAAGKIPTYAQRVKEMNKENEWLPMKDDFWWIMDLDENLNMSRSEYSWYDDVRVVFAFDN